VGARLPPQTVLVFHGRRQLERDRYDMANAKADVQRVYKELASAR
jgi:hypothetical protein